MRQVLSGVVIIGLGVLAGLQPGGCAGPLEVEAPGPTVEPSMVTDVLRHARDTVFRVELAVMLDRVDALEVAVGAWADAPEDSTAQAQARDAFDASLIQWSVMDALQVGPGASSLVSPAGKDLRDAVYSWPTVNPCRVDQETVNGEFGSASFYDQQLVNVYGLDALELSLIHI